MSTLQSYLAIIDPMLFTVIKAIRRTVEANGTGLDWAIAGDLAMYLYSYSAGLPPINLSTDVLDLRIRVTDVKHVSQLEGVVDELVKLGFTKKGKSELVYPLSSIRVTLSDVKDVKVVWMKNRKGKSTYPLLKPEIILDEKEELIKNLSLREKAVQIEVQEWMKEVMNQLVIE